MTIEEKVKKIIETSALSDWRVDVFEGEIKKAIIAATVEKDERIKELEAQVAEEKERADGILKAYEDGRRSNLSLRDTIGKMKEDRTAVEAEREVCAMIVKKEIELWDRESVVELRESILMEIRARSEGEKKGE